MMSALAPPIKMELAILLKSAKPSAGLNLEHVLRVMVSAVLVLMCLYNGVKVYIRWAFKKTVALEVEKLNQLDSVEKCEDEKNNLSD